MLMIKKALSCIGFLTAIAVARGGPPFVTDDPEPVEYQHWEVYLASQYQHEPDGAGGTLPHVEVNYGVMPNLQLHLIAPDAFDAPSGAARHFGYGDTELGAKYRFLEEAGNQPQVGVFPLVELPTGDSTRGLGSGHTQVFLPVWLQKSFGPWTTYGGTGYWINPGAGNRNWWFTGWLVQRQVVPSLAVGAEIFHETAQSEGGESDTKMNFGLTWDLSDAYHVLASVGPTLQGPRGYQAYLGFQWTFGPANDKGGK
jgi:hypothetical protein